MNIKQLFYSHHCKLYRPSIQHIINILFAVIVLALLHSNGSEIAVLNDIDDQSSMENEEDIKALDKRSSLHSKTMVFNDPYLAQDIHLVPGYLIHSDINVEKFERNGDDGDNENEDNSNSERGDVVIHQPQFFELLQLLHPKRETSSDGDKNLLYPGSSLKIYSNLPITPPQPIMIYRYNDNLQSQDQLICTNYLESAEFERVNDGETSDINHHGDENSDSDDDQNNGDEGKKELFISSPPLNQRYTLYDNFARGRQGEVWLANWYYSDNIDLESMDSNHVILKRVYPTFVLAGLREIHFGRALKDVPHVARFIETFNRTVVGKDPEMWLVFHEEGKSLDKFLYNLSPLTGMFEPSPFFLRLRGQKKMIESNRDEKIVDDCDGSDNCKRERQKGAMIRREIIRQLVFGAVALYEKGIVHRDLKPPNILLMVDASLPSRFMLRIGDFGSAVDEYILKQELFGGEGPSAKEETVQYRPPKYVFEDLFSNQIEECDASDTGAYQYERKNKKISSSMMLFDSWSIGIIALEMLLGRNDIFIPTAKEQVQIERFVSKVPLTQTELDQLSMVTSYFRFGIVPKEKDFLDNAKYKKFGNLTRTLLDLDENQRKSMFNISVIDIDPFKRGFYDDETLAPLELDFVWRLLQWSEDDRMTLKQACHHPYLTSSFIVKESGSVDQDESSLGYVRNEFKCPKCGRMFDRPQVCEHHVHIRKHQNPPDQPDGRFCIHDPIDPTTTSEVWDRTRCLLTSILGEASRNNKIGWCGIQGRREYSEDFYFSTTIGQDLMVIGVLDGHMGESAAKFCATRFMSSFSDLSSTLLSSTSTSRYMSLNLTEYLLQTFQNVANDFAASEDDTKDSGTTVTIAIISKSNNTITVANVGDSRAIVCCDENMQPIQLTMDHRPDLPEERKRIESIPGGFVTNSTSENDRSRVLGMAAVSRSLGYNSKVRKYLSSVPFTSTIKLDPKLHRFLVIATDGVWDALENRDVADMVLGYLKSIGSDGINQTKWYQIASEFITTQSYLRGSIDNIGTSIIPLN